MNITKMFLLLNSLTLLNCGASSDDEPAMLSRTNTNTSLCRSLGGPWARFTYTEHLAAREPKGFYFTIKSHRVLFHGLALPSHFYSRWTEEYSGYVPAWELERLIPGPRSSSMEYWEKTYLEFFDYENDEPTLFYERRSFSSSQYDDFSCTNGQMRTESVVEEPEIRIDCTDRGGRKEEPACVDETGIIVIPASRTTYLTTYTLIDNDTLAVSSSIVRGDSTIADVILYRRWPFRTQELPSRQ
jgi:hypothetical protein